MASEEHAQQEEEGDDDDDDDHDAVHEGDETELGHHDDMHTDTSHQDITYSKRFPGVFLCLMCGTTQIMQTHQSHFLARSHRVLHTSNKSLSRIGIHQSYFLSHTPKLTISLCRTLTACILLHKYEAS